MSFDAADSQLLGTVTQGLYERHTINVNANVGRATLTPDMEDHINPSVLLTRDDIRTYTGRSKVRDVIMDEYVTALGKVHGVSVERIDDDTMKVSMVPQRASKNEFSSLQSLQKRNAADLERDPELGDPIF